MADMQEMYRKWLGLHRKLLKARLEGGYVCDSCLRSPTGATRHNGHLLCAQCKAFFFAALVLLAEGDPNEAGEGVNDESVIIPTLAFALVHGWPAHDPSDPDGEKRAIRRAELLNDVYRGLRLLKVVEGVPILHISPAVVWPVKYDGVDYLKEIHLDIFSGVSEVVAHQVAHDYELVLRREGMRWSDKDSPRWADKCLGEEIRWKYNLFDHYLKGVVQLEELSPVEVMRYADAEFPQGRPAWPAPSSIKAAVGEKCSEFKPVLDRSGRGPGHNMKAKNLIPALAACWVGRIYKGDWGTEIPREYRPRVAEVVNTHILKPADRPTDEWLLGDRQRVVWRDARKVESRMILTENLIGQRIAPI